MSEGASAQFRAALTAGPNGIDLLRAAMTVGQIGDPELDIEHALASFHRLVEEVRGELGDLGSLDSRIEALNHALFTVRTFRGNRDDYDDPRNCFLHEVLSRRTGIPITLSLLYVEIGTRLGLPLEGVGFPAHFIVRAGPGSDSYQYLDPFNGGQRLDQRDLAAFLSRQGGDPERQLATFLAASTPRQVLERILNNLQGMYGRSGDYRRARASVEFYLVLSPWSLDKLRDRALLSAALDDRETAAADLRAYLTHERDAPDARRLRALLADLERDTP